MDDYEILVIINGIVDAMHKEENLSTTLSILDPEYNSIMGKIYEKALRTMHYLTRLCAVSTDESRFTSFKFCSNWPSKSRWHRRTFLRLKI